MPDLDKILAQAGQSLKAEDRVKLLPAGAADHHEERVASCPMLSDGQIVGINNKVKGLDLRPVRLVA